jgi:aminopeptidase
MDSRVREHAKILVEHSLDVQQGDEVVVDVPPQAEDLTVAIYEELGKRGAHPIRTLGFRVDSRADRAFKLAMDPEDYDEPPEALLKLAEEADALIISRGVSNTYEASDVPAETTAAYQRLMQPIMSKLMDSRWVGTQFPAPGNARDAEMSTDAYADFVYDAITLDWDEQREFQENMVEILDAGSEVRIVSGDTTDITMSIDGMIAANDYGERNLPGGEVYTAPVPDSVEGEVLFDKPLIRRGKKFEDVRLVFEEGEVVEYSAAKNEDELGDVLDTDAGVKRLGELGIGMNRQIDRFTHNMLFDEKMGDTVHMALGRAYEWTVGEDRERNESAEHMDMIVDMSEDSHIAVDGDIVQRDGTFVFEEGFNSPNQ